MVFENLHLILKLRVIGGFIDQTQRYKEIQKHLIETSARNQREETEPSDLYSPQPSELFTCEFCTNVILIFNSVVF